MGRKTIEVPADTSEKASRPERLVLNSTPVSNPEIFALRSNTAAIWVGSQYDVSADPGMEMGVDLVAGESCTPPASDLRDIWIAGTVDGEGVTWYGP